MNLPMTKRQFIELLTAELPESNKKGEIISAAKKLVPSETDQKQIYDLHSNWHILKAVRAYHQLHPETIKDKPSISNLVEWLLDMGAVDYAIILEKKLVEINEYAMSFGLISPNDEFTITATDLIGIRVLASVKPVLIDMD